MDEKTEVKKKPAPKVAKQKRRFIDVLIDVMLFVSFFGGLVAVSPVVTIGTEFIKSGLILTGIISAFILYVLRTLKKNEFSVPNNFLLYVLPILPLAYLVSAIVNPVPFVSIVGYGFEIGTVGFIFVMSLLVYLVSLNFRSKRYAIWFQIILFSVAGIISVMQVLNIVDSSILSSLNLGDSIIHLVGNDRDTAVFFGAILILALSALEFSPWGKAGKVVAGTLGIISIAMLSVTGFPVLWILLGLFALLLFVSLYSFSQKFFAQSEGNRMSYASLIVVVVSAVFIMFGPQIETLITSRLHIAQSTQLLPPTITETLPVVSQSFKENPVFGVGPNRFVTKWVQLKPDSVMIGPSWNVDYNYGNSLFLTSIVTVGALGVIAWLAVFLALIYMGVRYVFLAGIDKISGYLTFSLFILSVYLWISFAIHVPSSSIMMLGFFSLGLFVASLYGSGVILAKKFSFANKPVISFVIVLALVLVLIGGVAFDYVVMAKVYASHNYKQSIYSLNNGDYSSARRLMVKAATFGGSDIYYRGIADISIAELRAFAGQIGDQPTEIQLQKIDELTVNARQAAAQAIETDATNYLNYIAPGTVYGLFVSSNEKAPYYENSKAHYLKALELAPRVPSIYLALASLEQAKGNIEQAENRISEALNQKYNYTQARFLWSQIQIASGNTSRAISVLEEAARLSPFDAGIPFQIGLLRFERKEYRQSAENFERVIQLIPAHANARYYLGLNYQKLGRNADALVQFRLVKETNPDNTEIDSIIRGLENGSAAEVVPEIEEDALEELPIEEDN